jgi:hypothetical protein
MIGGVIPVLYSFYGKSGTLEEIGMGVGFLLAGSPAALKTAEVAGNRPQGQIRS